MSRHQIYNYNTIAGGRRVLRSTTQTGRDSWSRYFDNPDFDNGKLRCDQGGFVAMEKLIDHGDPFWIGWGLNVLERGDGWKHAFVEWEHSQRGMTTIFFESKQMVEGLAGQKLKMESSDLVPRWDVFSVAMPRGAKIGKVTACPFICMKMKDSVFHEKLNEMLASSPLKTNGGPLVSENEAERLWMYIWDQQRGKWFSATMMWRDLVPMISMGDKEWVMKVEQAGGDVPADLIRAHLRFVAGLFVFMDAFPGRVRPGLPDNVTPNELKVHAERSHIKKKVTPMTFEWPISIETGKPFCFVRKHLRFLKSDRYTHKKGTYIEVNAHERGEKPTPYTVTRSPMGP